MTDLIIHPKYHNRPSKRNAAQRPSSFGVVSRFNAAVDLAPLQDFVEQVRERFNRVMKTGDYARLCDLGKLLKKARERLDGAKAHNFKTGAKWAMLRQPLWRKKVLESLGGEAALVSWERRAAKAQDRAAAIKAGTINYNPPAYKRPPLMALRLGQYTLLPKRDPYDVKTDESGCFRLAAIPNPRAQKPLDYEDAPLTWQQEAERKEARHLMERLRYQRDLNTPPVDEAALKGYWYKDEAANTIYRIAPIPLLPGELRGQWDEEDVPDDEAETDLSGSGNFLDCNSQFVTNEYAGQNRQDNKHIEGPD